MGWWEPRSQGEGFSWTVGNLAHMIDASAKALYNNNNNNNNNSNNNNMHSRYSHFVQNNVDLPLHTMHVLLSGSVLDGWKVPLVHPC